LAADAVRTLAGESCGVAHDVLVETDPAAGLLPPATPPMADPAPQPPLEAAVDVGGTVVPGIAVAGSTRTDWLALEPAQRDGTLPVVVSVAGTVRPADRVALEFGRAGEVVERVPLTERDDRTENRAVVDHRI